MKIHHVGYLVKKINKAIESFKELGYKQESKICYDEYRDIDICFMSKDGYIIELVMPKSEKSVVYSMLKKIGNSPYHLCYEVDNIDESVKTLTSEKGYIIMGEKCKAPAINNKCVVFLFNKNIGMIELLERKENQ